MRTLLSARMLFREFRQVVDRPVNGEPQIAVFVVDEEIVFSIEFVGRYGDRVRLRFGPAGRRGCVGYRCRCLSGWLSFCSWFV